MAISEHHAKLDPGTPKDLDIARAALEEVIKFLPPGAEKVPDDAFRTERGLAVRDREPGRFRRARLEAVLDVYRELLARHARLRPGAEAIKRAFDAHFGSSALFGMYTMSLPDDVLRRASGDFEGAGGWDVQYRFGSEDGVEHLECFLSHRMTNDRICRVYADGRVEMIGSSTDGAVLDHDRAFYADARRRGFR